jgi:hypothetical protein
MKKFLFATAAVTCFMATTPAFAAPPIPVNMNVQNMCQVTKQPASITVTPTMNEDPNSPNFGQATSFASDTTGDNVHVFCNTPGSTLSIAASPLDGPTASPGAQSAGFTGTADFCALLTGGREADTTGAVWEALSSANASHCTTANHQFASYDYGVYQGNLNLSLNGIAPTGGQFLISGAYHGTVTITMSPETTFGV